MPNISIKFLCLLNRWITLPEQRYHYSLLEKTANLNSHCCFLNMKHINVDISCLVAPSVISCTIFTHL